MFAGGQAYVALSRCTSLEGIQLKKPISRADIFVRPEIVSFSGRFNNRQAIDKALKQAQADVQYAAAARAFDKGDFETCLEQFFLAIHSRYDCLETFFCEEYGLHQEKMMQLRELYTLPLNEGEKH